MNKISYKLVFNRKKQLNALGTALVQVEACLNGKKKFFSTKVYLQINQWDIKRRIIVNHPNEDAINQRLYEFMASIEQKELLLWQRHNLVSLDLLKESLKSNHTSSFLSFYRGEIESSPLKESSKRNHLTTLNLLSNYNHHLTFYDLNFEFLLIFDQYLRAKGYRVNTIAKHMKQLKSILNIAINKGYMEQQDYPFRKYKIKTVETHKEHLTPEELGKMEQLILKDRQTKLQKSLDAFLFCCYSGLRYSDFRNLNMDNIVTLDGKIWLMYRTQKTGAEIHLPLYLLFEGKGLQILGKYLSDPSVFFKLKDNSHINKELARLCQLAGITKKISFHCARHTNATLLIYSGANITTVQKLLGHKSVKTTQIYSNIMDMTIIEDLLRCRNTNLLPIN
ncbi:MAG: site-specific integrase [Bacteroides sp.]